MGIEHRQALTIAEAHTAVWNSGSTDAVAQFLACDGGILINRGVPWQGCANVSAMSAGFFADAPDLSLTCNGVRCAGGHVA